MGLGSTNARGELNVDLSRNVNAKIFNVIDPPLSMQVRVGSDLYGLVDLEDVADYHTIRRDQAWDNVDATRCDVERTAEACQEVQSFLSAYGDGPLTREAHDLIEQMKQHQALKAQQAQNAQRAKQVATSTCQQQCVTRCESNQQCAAQCIQQRCR